MYVESFHKVIKYMYLKGKTNKRVDKCMDKCIQMLMKYEQDKIFERLGKGKNIGIDNETAPNKQKTVTKAG